MDHLYVEKDRSNQLTYYFKYKYVKKPLMQFVNFKKEMQSHTYRYKTVDGILM